MTRFDCYRQVCAKMAAAPQALSEKDFDVLREFDDEARGRAAQKKAQLALVPPDPPPEPETRRLRKRVAELEATNAALREENQTLAQAVVEFVKRDPP
jgi:hypothetical protein